MRHQATSSATDHWPASPHRFPHHRTLAANPTFPITHYLPGPHSRALLSRWSERDVAPAVSPSPGHLVFRQPHFLPSLRGWQNEPYAGRTLYPPRSAELCPPATPQPHLGNPRLQGRTSQTPRGIWDQIRKEHCHPQTGTARSRGWGQGKQHGLQGFGAILRGLGPVFCEMGAHLARPKTGGPRSLDKPPAERHRRERPPASQGGRGQDWTNDFPQHMDIKPFNLGFSLNKSETLQLSHCSCKAEVSVGEGQAGAGALLRSPLQRAAGCPDRARAAVQGLHGSDLRHRGPQRGGPSS